ACANSDPRRHADDADSDRSEDRADDPRGALRSAQRRSGARRPGHYRACGVLPGAQGRVVHGHRCGAREARGLELSHALQISKHIDHIGDYLGGMPCATPKPMKLTEKEVEMVRADLQNEKDTIRAYRERMLQCDALSEYAIAEDIGAIVRHQREHRIDLA